MNIQPYLNEITQLLPMNQDLTYNPNHWLNYNFANPNIAPRIQFIVMNYPNLISRNDIISYLRSTEMDLLTGFLLTMIWGHGAGPHGNMDNRGPYKVNEMTLDIANTNFILTNCHHALNRNDILTAFNSFGPMSRIRVNFFSKFLYFLGKALNLERYPLIFDARVASTMCRLNSLNTNIFQLLTIAPGQDYLTYESYLNIIHNESQLYNIDADKIEYFLFLNV
jgi:hypothetical protein